MRPWFWTPTHNRSQAYAQGEEVFVAFGAQPAYAPPAYSILPKTPQSPNTGVLLGVAAATGAGAYFSSNPWFLLGRKPVNSSKPLNSSDDGRPAPTNQRPVPIKDTPPGDQPSFRQEHSRFPPAAGPQGPAQNSVPSFSPSPPPQSQSLRATLETGMNL